ncbi:hypothetical protein [Sediminispirochaeta smaragdinae]|uniref:Uncharacterized protein n=1 Tax=Sediminispirochaeta smaragdinae (strain DSM 11293 / JCM 15392 / SEBR 4228) TaxID=573413 RepID=E1R4F8_SEDSS|nr:hypothetical protein [Sediminispirochaeta smaragdinae]ADK81699.1 hypothetical protein Spirs_2589 [Sediminispirochaeta smaragdinae DSM 11293]
MVTFLIFAVPIIGCMLLFWLFPGWYRDKLFFPAGIRAFLWFWIGTAVSIFWGIGGINAYAFAPYLLQRWLIFDLPPMAAAFIGFSLWRSARERILSGERLLFASLLYAVVVSMFSGCVEAVFWFKQYNGFALFFLPLALVARMIFLWAFSLLFVQLEGGKRWVLSVIGVLAVSFFIALGPSFVLINQHLFASILAILILAASLLMIQFAIRAALPSFRLRHLPLPLEDDVSPVDTVI